MSKSISRKSNRRQGPGSSKEKEPLSDSGRPGSSKQKETLSLCFYTLDRTARVVLREKLDPPNALEGTVANAPLPVDFPETQTGAVADPEPAFRGGKVALFAYLQGKSMSFCLPFRRLPRAQGGGNCPIAPPPLDPRLNRGNVWSVSYNAWL